MKNSLYWYLWPRFKVGSVLQVIRYFLGGCLECQQGACADRMLGVPYPRRCQQQELSQQPVACALRHLNQTHKEKYLSSSEVIVLAWCCKVKLTVRRDLKYFPSCIKAFMAKSPFGSRYISDILSFVAVGDQIWFKDVFFQDVPLSFARMCTQVHSSPAKTARFRQDQLFLCSFFM